MGFLFLNEIEHLNSVLITICANVPVYCNFHSFDMIDLWQKFRVTNWFFHSWLQLLNIWTRNWNTLEYCMRSTTSSLVSGIRPILCAMNSSNKTVEFDSIWTQSIAEEKKINSNHERYFDMIWAQIFSKFIFTFLMYRMVSMDILYALSKLKVKYRVTTYRQVTEVGIL